MYNRESGGDDSPLRTIDDAGLTRVCREHTDLSDEDIKALLDVSHNLRTVHELEDGDIFIDCLTTDGKKAVVIAQHSPPGSNYTRNIVGELMLPHNEPGVFRTLQIGVPSRRLKAVVTGEHLIRQNVSAIRGPQDKIVGVLIVERHIRGPELWEQAAEKDGPGQQAIHLAYDAREMERVAEYMNDGMVRFNQDAVAVYANPRAREIYRGINYMDEIVGMPFENLAFGNILFEDIRQQGRNAHTEVQIGGYILNVVYASINDEDNFMGAVMIIDDATEEKSIEKELILKSAAIAEIHHRVKNNLQTIISLLRLQRRRITNADARTAFSETMSRIFSISLTHEILAQKGVDDVEIKEMLSRMLNNAKSYIIPDDLDLNIEIVGDCIEMNSDTATSISMVVNELVQNCIKHAFVDRSVGSVLLSIRQGPQLSTVAVEDDGVGFSTTSRVRSGSLGHKLVKSLVEDKLFGQLQIHSSDHGTRVSFTFLNETEKLRQQHRKDTMRRMLEQELENTAELDRLMKKTV